MDTDICAMCREKKRLVKLSFQLSCVYLAITGREMPPQTFRNVYFYPRVRMCKPCAKKFEKECSSWNR